LPALKLGILVAATVRAARSLTSNVPKPTNRTFSPEVSAVVTACVKALNACSAALLVCLHLW